MKRLLDPSKRLFNDRIDYSKVSGKFPLPNLVAIQTDSYQWFLNEGLQKYLLTSSRLNPTVAT